MLRSVHEISQNYLHVEEHASDLAELPVPVIWQNCLYVEERVSHLAELPVLCYASDLAVAELPVCRGACQ